MIYSLKLGKKANENEAEVETIPLKITTLAESSSNVTEIEKEAVIKYFQSMVEDYLRRVLG